MKYELTYESLAPKLDSESKVFYAAGCSMTYGQELLGYSRWSSVYHQTPPDAPENYHERRLAAGYPGLVKEKLFPDHVLMNDAMCGGSNHRIVRRTMHHVADMLSKGVKPENIFVLVGFTSMARIEVYDNHPKRFHDLHLNMNYEDDKDASALCEMFIRRFNSTAATIQQAMTLIASLESFLKANGVKYLFSVALGMITSLDLIPSNYPSVYDNALFKLFRGERWVGWDEKYGKAHKIEWSYSMRNYCLHMKNLPVGPEQHPLEDSHVAWANYIEYHINKNKEIFL